MAMNKSKQKGYIESRVDKLSAILNKNDINIKIESSPINKTSNNSNIMKMKNATILDNNVNSNEDKSSPSPFKIELGNISKEVYNKSNDNDNIYVIDINNFNNNSNDIVNIEKNKEEYIKIVENYNKDHPNSNSNDIRNSINNNNNNNNNDNNYNNNVRNHAYYNKQQSKNYSDHSSFSNSRRNSSVSNKAKEKIQIHFGVEYYQTQQKLPNNSISTTKYSFITFIPKSLFLQFQRAANIYFLIVSILTCFDFSPKQPSSMIGTFAFVLIATMIKEFFEDYSRYKQDKFSNERLVTKLTPNGWQKVQCKTLHPGELVKIFKEEEFSADIVVVHTSNTNGYVFIDTKNLDGESNLKEKSSVEEYHNIKNFEKFCGKIKCEKSNENLFNFEGVITAKTGSGRYLDNSNPDISNFNDKSDNVMNNNNNNNNHNINDNNDIINETSLFISMRNMILKGCTLKNTDFCIGIVVYAGSNTKIMKNSKNPRVKVSKVLRIMNILLYSLFALTIAICFILAGVSMNFKNTSEDNRPYIYDKFVDTISNQSDGMYFIVRILIFFVAYSNIIPISLYVALEVVKIVQGFLIFYDNDLYDIVTEKPARCRATDLIEELGQVDFIFSDKTGTLTQNVMVLKRCYVAEEVFGLDDEEMVKVKNSSGNLSNANNNNSKNINKSEIKFTINGDKEAYNILLDPLAPVDKKQRIEDFFNILSLCHSVFPEFSDKGITYQGASPDDIALVEGAAQLGFVFSSKDYHQIKIINQVLEKEKIFDLLVEMPFDSDRKRMSVVVRDLDDGSLKLLSKGADTVMNKRINWEYTTQSEAELAAEVMDIFCKEGLRCLMFAQKDMTEEEYKEWREEYNYAIAKGRELTRYFDDIENDLQFIGVSAIEDKLQEGVGNTIYSLSNCGIRIWVLTGDKQDTAIEIAKSCKLIRDDFKLIKLTNSEAVESAIVNLIADYELNTEEFLGEDFIQKLQAESNIDASLAVLENEHNKIKRNIDLMRLREHFVSKQQGFQSCLIIDGVSLEIILNSYCLSGAFFYIASACSSIVCCRVSPKQKSSVVKLAKQFGDWVTLSIGDGANDVPMIMEANIGVGIQGKEGTQAVRSSDFSISQFRFLNKLLLDYGRNGYKKISKFICYYFYKNILLSLTEMYFSFYNGFSGQIFFADYLNTMYNAFFTSWPCIAFIFEKEHSCELCQRFPILYNAGQRNHFFNMKIFWSYVFYAILHSAFCFYIPFSGFDGIVNDDGFHYNLWYVSIVSFSIIIHTVTFKILIMSNFWNFIIILTTIGSIIFYYICLIVLCNNNFSINFQPEVIGIGQNILQHTKTIIIILFAPILILMTDYITKQVHFILFPDPSEYLTYFIKKKMIPLVDARSNLEIQENNNEAFSISNRLSKFFNQKNKNTISNQNKSFISSKLARSMNRSMYGDRNINNKHPMGNVSNNYNSNNRGMNNDQNAISNMNNPNLLTLSNNMQINIGNYNNHNTTNNNLISRNDNHQNSVKENRNKNNNLSNFHNIELKEYSNSSVYNNNNNINNITNIQNNNNINHAEGELIDSNYNSKNRVMEVVKNPYEISSSGKNSKSNSFKMNINKNEDENIYESQDPIKPKSIFPDNLRHAINNNNSNNNSKSFITNKSGKSSDIRENDKSGAGLLLDNGNKEHKKNLSIFDQKRNSSSEDI